ncbi:MAG: DNA methyltransferase [Armatimonadota bacterium]|nr:DNA methyltransferase [Armatimonadota bacterium]
MAVAVEASRAEHFRSFLAGFNLLDQCCLFSDDGRGDTSITCLSVNDIDVPVFTNEFWTARQRQAASIHEISYRACYKPQLPRFFIELLTKPDDVVYDPFGGRGTTAIEAGLLSRRAVSNDINPISQILAQPRFCIPSAADVAERLQSIPRTPGMHVEFDLSMFYHPDTEAEIIALRNYLASRRADRTEDELDMWIRMVATNRLTGHSPGFFSVYTLPPNQAVTPDRQVKINKKRNQSPDYRDTSSLIVRKTRTLTMGLSKADKDALRHCGESVKFLTGNAQCTSSIPDNYVTLTVTSPPFLDVVQYATDNWLRSWFNNIDAEEVSSKITMARTVEAWSIFVEEVLLELHRITKPGGWVAFEVGEVRGGRVRLEEYVAPVGVAAGFQCEGILVNEQTFTKTANIWGVSNNAKGTNSNRIVLFSK